MSLLPKPVVVVSAALITVGVALGCFAELLFTGV